MARLRKEKNREITIVPDSDKTSKELASSPLNNRNIKEIYNTINN